VGVTSGESAAIQKIEVVLIGLVELMRLTVGLMDSDLQDSRTPRDLSDSLQAQTVGLMTPGGRANLPGTP
jgi:hypothetical protein